MSYVVKLGTVSAQRNYTLKQQGSGLAWKRGPAQPFAAKVNTANQYDQVDTWNEWVQEDWQTGVGRVDPTSGGYLYGEIETRVPNQVILPPLLQQCDLRTINNTKSDCRYMPQSMAGTHTLGDSGDYDRMAVSFTTSNPYSPGIAFIHVAVYAQIPLGVTATIAIYSNSAGAPNASIVAGTVTGTAPDKTFQWYGVRVSNTGLAAATQYWLVIHPTTGTDTIEVAYGTSGYDTASQAYNNAAWAALTGKYMFYTTDVFRVPATSSTNSFYIRFNSVLYYAGEGALYKYDSANEQFDSVGTVTGSGDITSVAVFGPTLYFGRDSGNYTTMSTAEAFTAAATTGYLFLEWKGYLYRSTGNDLYFTANGTDWTGPFTFGGDDVGIRGLAGMGDSVYVATDKALLRFAPGNVVEEVTRFGTESNTNGVGMIEYQGRLYIPAGGRLFRFDPSGQMQDIWVSREDDLVTNRIGKIASLARMNNWLVACVTPELAGGRPSIWLYQEEGWHFLESMVAFETTSISSTEVYGLYYDRATHRLWFDYTSVFLLFVKISDYTLNPYNDSGSLYMPRGWLEQDRFYGGQYLLDKDFESVTIVGDNLSTNVNVKVYWQDEGSTGWELHGTATSDGQELRWGDHSTRPQGKWIKLGLLLSTNDGDETPRVRAVIVKFLPMVNDRIRDTVTITLKNYIQLPDGTPDTYTAAQQLTHIESMIESVIPIIYTDPLGVSYEAKVVDYSMGIDIFAHENSANVIKEVEATLVIEQVPDVSLSGQPSGMLLALTRS
jgi:hypothetical protein